MKPFLGKLSLWNTMVVVTTEKEILMFCQSEHPGLFFPFTTLFSLCCASTCFCVLNHSVSDSVLVNSCLI